MRNNVLTMAIYRGRAPARRAGQVGPALTSNFNSAAPLSAQWYALNPDGTTTLWRASGFGFVNALQTALQSASSGVSYDGHNVDGSMVRVDSKWGPTTSRVLWAEINRLGFAPEVKAVVAADARAHRISIGSLAAAIAYLNQLPFTSIRLPSDVITPPWSASPPSSDEGVYGTPVTSATSPSADPAAVPAPAPVPDPVVVDAPVPNTPGADIPAPTPEPLPPDVTDDVRRPSGLEAMGMSNLPWAAIAVAVGVVGVVAVTSGSLRKSVGSKGRRSKRR